MNPHEAGLRIKRTVPEILTFYVTNVITFQRSNVRQYDGSRLPPQTLPVARESSPLPSCVMTVGDSTPGAKKQVLGLFRATAVRSFLRRAHMILAANTTNTMLYFLDS